MCKKLILLCCIYYSICVHYGFLTRLNSYPELGVGWAINK